MQACLPACTFNIYIYEENYTRSSIFGIIYIREFVPDPLLFIDEILSGILAP